MFSARIAQDVYMLYIVCAFEYFLIGHLSQNEYVK